MATIFSRIIAGELPGRFVWEDDRCVAFLTINPLKPGHVMVVPRAEVDHWLDLDPDLARHLMGVSQSVGRALELGFKPTKVGLVIVGLEVPHVHIHLCPIDEIWDLDFANVDPDPGAQALDDAARRIREALRELGHADVSERG